MKNAREEFEHIVVSAMRVLESVDKETPMQRVWKKYEQSHGPVSEPMKRLVEVALSLELYK